MAPTCMEQSEKKEVDKDNTLSLGAVLLDLEQNTLPGIANLVVETLMISDQIRTEDRANVLRALLLKHRSATWQNNHVNIQNMLYMM